MKKILPVIVFLGMVAVAAVLTVTRRNPAPKTVKNAVGSTDTAPANYYFPISFYTSRRLLRTFGTYVTSQDVQTVPCGAPFTGYHTGDDLEVTSDEISRPVSVYSIAAGRVLKVGSVSGYGGLLIIAYNLNNQPVTAYFGHINLATVAVTVGETVKPGEKLAELGAACSAQTGGERKHLHFALHKGPKIDERGYVSNRMELSNWLNPLEALKNLGAKSP